MTDGAGVLTWVMRALIAVVLIGALEIVIIVAWTLYRAIA